MDRFLRRATWTSGAGCLVALVVGGLCLWLDYRMRVEGTYWESFYAGFNHGPGLHWHWLYKDVGHAAMRFGWLSGGALATALVLRVPTRSRAFRWFGWLTVPVAPALALVALVTLILYAPRASHGFGDRWYGAVTLPPGDWIAAQARFHLAHAVTVGAAWLASLVAVRWLAWSTLAGARALVARCRRHTDSAVPVLHS